MEAKASYVVVGLFVLLLGVAAVASLFWLGGWGRGEGEIYLVLMEESVSGLTVDAPVKYRGVDVGHVVSMALRPEDPHLVELTLSVDPAAPVLVDTRAQLEFQGLTGLAFVNLIGGSPGAPRLGAEAGQKFPVIRSAPSIFARLDTGVSGLLVSVTETSDRLAELLQDVDRQQLARTLDNLDRLMRTLSDSSAGLGSALANVDRLTASAAEAGEKLPGLVDRLDDLAGDWQAAGREVRRMASSGSEDLQLMTGEVAGNVQLLTADLRRLVERLDRVVTELEEDPSVFVYGRTITPAGPGE